MSNKYFGKWAMWVSSLHMICVWSVRGFRRITSCAIWKTLLKLVPNCAGTGLASSKQGTEISRIVLSRQLSAAFRELQKTDNGP